jgi:hypothetical protein
MAGKRRRLPCIMGGVSVTSGSEEEESKLGKTMVICVLLFFFTASLGFTVFVIDATTRRCIPQKLEDKSNHDRNAG